MHPITHKVSSFLEDLNLGQRGILMACSGGVDSMVLLHLLIALDYKPVVAHCNFKLRDKDAELDESFVLGYCQALGIEVYSQSFDTTQHAEERGISIQMAARELRYSYFEEMLQKHKLEYVVTAHHADDQLETILLNLGRGTGFRGMAGIRSQSGSLLRPLYNVFKSQILEYANAHKLNWREDASNQKEDYQRNALRLNVMKPLAEIFPHFESSTTKSLKYLGEDRKLFDDLVNRELERLLEQEEEMQKLNIAELQKQGHSAAILRHWLMPIGPVDIEAITQSLDGESGALFHFHGYELLKDRDYLILKPQKNVRDKEYWINRDTARIDTPVSLEFQKLDYALTEIPRNSSVAALDYDRLQFPLQLRRWEQGDSFRPLGMKGLKKLSDYFVDRKFSRFEKEEAWLLCSGNDIVWIVNERIDDRYKVSDTTKTVYFVRLY